MTPAPLYKRALNLLIDSAFTAALIMSFYIFLFVVTKDIELVKDIIISLGSIIQALFAFFYYIFCEGRYQKTFGKYLTGTKVVMLDGNRIADYHTLIIRTLIRYIPIEPLSFFIDDPIGWHDKWTHTIVVNDK